jgi:GTP-binding protein
MKDSTEETIPEALPAKRTRFEGLPLVVIAGRPNVGKSTLFNRLLHKRRAITDPTPGVTRDPIEAECLLRDSGRRFRLVDTGGFKLDREGLDGLVVEKSLSSIERADLIIFLVDAQTVTPEDEEFAGLLRRWTDKVLLVVNKADSPERDPLAWGHLRWGFGDMIFVSAEHGRNIDELEEAMIARLDFSKVVEVDIERAPIRLAILGKPNTGKSTLLNRLLGEDKSIVSAVPGTTRDPVEGRFNYKKRDFRVLDTAGIRRKSKVTESVEYYSVTRAIKSVDDCDVVVHMIDAREGLTDQDKKIAAFAAEQGRGVVFVLNKWDEMPDVKNTFEASRDKLRYFFGQMAFAPVLPLSARDGTGVDKLLNTIITIFSQLTKEVETSRLMKNVTGWIETTPPPVGPKTKWKLRYAVQTSVNPQRFSFFVTKVDAVADSYVSFLRNKIREDLKLDLVPVILELKASRQGWVEREEGRRSGAVAASRPAKKPAAAGAAEGAPTATAKKRSSAAAASKTGTGQAKAAGEGPWEKRLVEEEAKAKREGSAAPTRKKTGPKKVPASRRVQPAAAKKAQKPDNRRKAAKAVSQRAYRQAKKK